MLPLNPDLTVRMAREHQRESIGKADAWRLAASLRPKLRAATRPSRPRLRLHLGHGAAEPMATAGCAAMTNATSTTA